MCEGKCGGCFVHKTARVLVYVGALNWGLVGLGMFFNGDWNVVNWLLGSWPMLEAVVYVLVGVSAVLKFSGKHCKKCMAVCSSCNAGMGEKSM